MLNLLRAIARLITRTTKPTVDTPVSPTQAAGLVPLGRITLTGKAHFAQDTNPQPRYVKPQVKAKSNRVLKGTQGQSQVQKQVPAQQEVQPQFPVSGLPQVTPAKPSSQQKRKRSPAKSTTAGESRKQEQSQPASQARGKQSQTPASKTRRHAKQAAKSKH